MPKLLVQRLDALRRILDEKRRAGIPFTGKPTPWREIAKSYPGVPPGTLCAVYKGREPHKATIRTALGLPVLAEGRVCPIHHKVHDRLCSAERKVTKRKDWKGLSLTLAGLLANIRLSKQSDV